MLSNKKMYAVICIVISIFFVSFYFFNECIIKQGFTPCNSGTIIILNGPSSVGKSSIQKKIQKLFEQPYLRMGLDDLAFLPIRYISVNGPIPPADQGIWLDTTQKDGHQVVTIHYGVVAQAMMKGIHRTFASFAAAGNNIVVDYILYDPAWLADLVHTLKGLTVYFIGVNAPLSVIEEREKQRGNRLFGHARSHYNTVHKGLVYDLEIDSSSLTPEESALAIKKFIEECPYPKAFNKNYGL